jgi:hypothetical protein
VHLIDVLDVELDSTRESWNAAAFVAIISGPIRLLGDRRAVSRTVVSGGIWCGPRL